MSEGCVIVTGGSGFIGTAYIDFLLKNGKKVINIDKETYASYGKYTSSKKIENFVHYRVDINNTVMVSEVLREYKADYIINFAAESHVDRSITGPSAFFTTNVNGVVNLLNVLKEIEDPPLFVQISTDEVYGSVSRGESLETDILLPNSPYSASKASAEMVCRAYERTYGIDYIITRTCNNYGMYQNREKFIPTIINNLLDGKKVPLYGSGENIREWIYVFDNVEIIDNIIRKCEVNEVYNIGTGHRKTNKEIIEIIVKELVRAGKIEEKQKIEDYYEYVEDRKGHDHRYALNYVKAKEKIGSNYKVTSLEEGVNRTLEWYIENGI